MHRQLDLDTLLRIPSVDTDGEGFHISPDGRRLAFSWNKTGQWQIYLTGLEDNRPTQITEGTESSVSPRFSPDGKHLAYAQDYQGDEKFDIFLVDLDSKETRNITLNTAEAILPFIRWSPDAGKIAFASNRSGKYSVYSMPYTGGEPSLFCNHSYADSDPRWSPDGKWVMFTSMTKGQDVGVFIVSAKGGEPLPLGDEGGPLDASMPSWSLDSKRVAFASTSHGMSDIGIFDLGERKVEWLTDSSHECYDPCWSPDGLSLAYRENHEGDVGIALHRIRGEKRAFQMEPGVHTQLAFTGNSRYLVFTFSGPSRPADLWVLDLEEEEFRQLTDSLQSSIDRSVFVSPSVVSYESLGGRSIPALLYSPQRLLKDKALPAIIYIHGGPAAQHENDWYPEVQDLVARGLVVLAPNYRGSTGFGKELRDANRFVMGTDDLADIVAAADFLEHNRLADPGRIAVTGISYGGYLTMCALTRFPNRWAAGAALFPFLNWFTEFESEREDLQYWDRENMGDPVKNAERFREASPIFFIERVEAPVQIVAGAQDPRCPMSESVQARDALQKLGRPIDFIVYEDEGHGFRKTENRVGALKRRADFLEKHLASR
jgi:dipeptidyl aminopeptidase/acylaminoacyl peptidase